MGINPEANSAADSSIMGGPNVPMGGPNVPPGRLRDGIDLASESGDRVSADILTDVQRSAEKNLWLLEAHIPKVRS